MSTYILTLMFVKFAMSTLVLKTMALLSPATNAPPEAGPGASATPVRDNLPNDCAMKWEVPLSLFWMIVLLLPAPVIHTWQRIR